MLIITIVTSLKNYKQQQMKSEIVRKTSTLHDNVFRCAFRTPPCGLSFLSDCDWIEKDWPIRTPWFSIIGFNQVSLRQTMSGLKVFRRISNITRLSILNSERQFNDSTRKILPDCSKLISGEFVSRQLFSSIDKLVSIILFLKNSLADLTVDIQGLSEFKPIL